MKEQIAHIWNEHDVHDAPLVGLHFDFEAAEICVNLELSDDEAGEYVPFKMIFGGIFKFTSDYPADISFKPDGCYGWNWTELETGKFEAQFELTIGYSPLWTVTIGFTSLRTEGGLSEEARAARAAYFEEQTQA